MNIQQMYHYHILNHPLWHLKYHHFNLFLHTHLFITLFLQYHLGRISLPLTFLPPFIRIYSHSRLHSSYARLKGILAHVLVAITSTLKVQLLLMIYMCIRHHEWLEYMPQGSQILRSRFGNVYYHFQPHCIWVKCSLASSSYGKS